ncbi:MAG: hypothetical protein L0Y72_04200 [Gemmataceae bacterium]|nr:hypothetical protein [Gemmataceae bacterium]
MVRHVGAPFSRAESWPHIATMLGHWQLRGYGMWAVEDRTSAALIGRIEALVYGIRREEWRLLSE